MAVSFVSFSSLLFLFCCLQFAIHRKRTVADFDVCAVVGKGNYGVVFMARERSAEKRCLAVKRMAKCVLMERNQVLTIMTEALVMKGTAILRCGSCSDCLLTEFISKLSFWSFHRGDDWQQSLAGAAALCVQ